MVAAWRAEQADVNAGIKVLARDPADDQLNAEITKQGLPAEMRRERLRAYFDALRDG